MDDLDFENYMKQFSTDVPMPPGGAPMPASVIPEPDLSKYESDIAKAKDEAERQRKMSYIAQAMQGIGTAHAVSRGMKPLSTGIYEEMRATADRPVAEALSAKDQALKAWMDKKKLEHMAKQAEYTNALKEKWASERSQAAAQRAADTKTNQDFNKQLGLMNLQMRQSDVARDIAKEQEGKAEKAEQLLVPGMGYALTADDAKKLKEAQETKKSFDRKLDELQQLRSEYGVEYMNREAVARGKQLSNSLLLDFKNLAKLGVLSQSDEKIINAIIPEDPLGQDYAIGQDPILSGIKKLKGDVNADYESTVSTRMREKPPVGGTPVDRAVDKPAKTVVKKEVNQKLGKTRVTYSDGTTEVLDGIQ